MSAPRSTIEEPPELPRERTRDTAVFRLILAALAVADLAAVGVALGSPVAPEPRLVAFLIHLMVIVSTAALVWARTRRGFDSRVAWIAAVSTPTLGPIGILGALLAAIPMDLRRGRDLDFHHWYLSLFPEEETTPAEELYDLIVSGRANADTAATVSFMDIMEGSDPARKQAVVALVARHFHPSFTPILKAALADADPTVRVQAATAAARIENAFSQRWMELDREVRRRPANVTARLELARLLDAHAFRGLLDPDREAECRRQALAHYFALAREAPRTPGLTLDLGRLLLRLGRFDEAADLLRVTAENDTRGLIWYAECLFRLGRYAELRSLCHDGIRLLSPQGVDPTLLVFDLWSEAR